MARIVIGSWVVRHPLGGNLSWALQYLVGFARLGHDVHLVEKAGWENACYDARTNEMTDDCSYGTAVVSELLERHGLGGRWSYVDAAGAYHGLGAREVEALFDSADVYVDMGAHGSWAEESAAAGLRVLVDGEPGFTQMKLQARLDAGEVPLDYDAYYTTGANIGDGGCDVPDAARSWRWLFHPVVTDLFRYVEPPPGAPYTTVMNWQSYEPLRFRGSTYGHKDIEFAKFMDLPQLTTAPLEVAVAGPAPRESLRSAGWRVRDGHDVTVSFASFQRYIEGSRGEFSVCKNGYVATAGGWFSDRSAAYLASGRPVVMQDTGFGTRLPCGEGLFAVRDAEEAAAAIEEIEGDYERHASAARELAREHLDASVQLGRMLGELGVA